MIRQRFFVLILIATLIVGSIGYAQPNDEQIREDEQVNQTEIVAKLYSLNLLDTWNVDYEAQITRGGFADATMVLFDSGGFDPMLGLSDINGQTKYSGAICTAVRMGFMKPNSKGEFRPDEHITYQEAVEAFVRMLGYNFLIEQSSGLRHNNLVFAAQRGVTRGVDEKPSEFISMNQFLKLFNNALDIEVLHQTQYGSMQSFETKQGVTLLSENLNIHKERAVVTGNYYTSLTGKGTSRNNQIYMDETLFYIKDIELGNLLGERVEFYYSENDGDLTLLYAKSINTDVITISAEEYIRHENRRLYYWDGSKKETFVNILPEADYIFNNIADNSGGLSHLPIDSGNIMLVDNNNDGIYDVVKIFSHENLVVQSVDMHNRIIYNKYAGKTLDFSNPHLKANITDSDGNDISLNELSEWDVITFCMSEDEQVVTGVVAASEVEGAVEAVSWDGDIQVVTIDDKELKISEGYRNHSEINIGDHGIFYLDAEGKIAAVRYDLTDIKYIGYVSAASYTKDLKRSLIMRIFTAKGEFETFVMANRVNIDGNTDLDKSEILSYLSHSDETGETFKPQVIIYHINNSREIVYIDTHLYNEVKENNNTLEKYYTSFEDANGNPLSVPTTLNYKQSTGVFDGKVCSGANTIFFVVPRNNPADEEQYKIRSASFLQSDQGYSIEAYRTIEDSHIADIILLDSSIGSGNIDEDTTIFVIERVSNVLNDKLEPVKKIAGYSDGKKLELVGETKDVFEEVYAENDTTKVNAYTVGPGDIIRYSTNLEGKITFAEIVFSAENELLLTNTSTSKFSAKYRIIYANVYDMYKNIIQVCFNEPSTFNANNDSYEYYPANLYKIMVCDMSTSKPIIYEGGLHDIRDYKHNGIYSKVIVHSRYGDPKNLIVYIYR